MDIFFLRKKPPSWEMCSLEHCCIMISDTCNPETANNMPYLGLEHLASCFPALVGVGDPSQVRSTKTRFHERDILYGKLRPYLQKAVLAPFAGICSTDILVLRTKKSILPEFFTYLVHSQQFVEHAKATTSGVNHPRTSWNKLKPYVVPLPPLPEQRRIASVLSLVQRAIEQQDRLIALTTELKKALMHKLFTEGTRGEPQKETQIGLIPESWDLVELQTTGDVVYGIQASVANNFEPVGTKILTNKNINLEGRFDLDKINYFELRTKRHYQTILRKGDLLFNWRSGSKEHVGKTAYFDLDGEYTHSSFILRIRPKESVNSRFLYHFFNWLRESGYFMKLQTYAVNAKFNKSAVNALPIAKPSVEEQSEIAGAVDIVIYYGDIAKRRKDALNDLFRTLLHQLMTAEVRVNDLDLEELGIHNLELGIRNLESKVGGADDN
ncbi:MAG: restriction endonuclease subunit S [Deltaproteobacteria bacterium]|nr:restriction endonuclease subunit S [Deltaproteobacteria bacterium]